MVWVINYIICFRGYFLVNYLNGWPQKPLAMGRVVQFIIKQQQ